MLLCKTHYFERFHKSNRYVGGDDFKQKVSADVQRAGSEASKEGSVASVTDGVAQVAVSDATPAPDATPVSPSSQPREQESVFTFGGEKAPSSPSAAQDPARPTLTSDLSAESAASTSSTGSVKDRMKAFSAAGNTGAKCKPCGKTVYPADPQITLDGAKFHKSCAKCADCSCQISLANFTKCEDELLCKTHYFQRFHENNSYVGGDKFAKAGSADAQKAGAAGGA